MSLTINERRRYVAEAAKRYQEGSKGEKSAILNEFVAVGGLNRSYASYLLSKHGVNGKEFRFGDTPKLYSGRHNFSNSGPGLANSTSRFVNQI